MSRSAPEGVPPGQDAPRRRIRLEGVSRAPAPDGNCLVSVRLAWRERPGEGRAAGVDTQPGRVRATAEATLAGVLSLAGQGLSLSVVGVKAFRAFDGWVVVVRVVGGAGGRSLRLLGASSTEDEGTLERAAAQAVLDAVNRAVSGLASS